MVLSNVHFLYPHQSSDPTSVFLSPQLCLFLQMFCYSSWLTSKPNGLFSCGRMIIRDTYLCFHVLYFPCVCIKISFTIPLHPTSNGQVIPYSYPQGRTIIDSLWLSRTLFQKGQLVQSCWVAEWFIIFWAKKSSSMARLGRRDHGQTHKVRVSKLRAWVPERPW